MIEPTEKKNKQDARLESEGAEFLVLGKITKKKVQ